MESTVEILKQCEENGTAPKYVVQDDTYRKEKFKLFKKYLPIRTDPVKYESKNEEIFVVSDLHIASGRDEAGVYPGTENFFADESFKRFLEFANKNKQSAKALLIINGDIFDFLRITEYPGKGRKYRTLRKVKYLFKGKILKDIKPTKDSVDKEFEQWSEELSKIGIEYSTEKLELSISKKEKRFGLKTDPFKTIYKLMLIKDGHSEFFKALADWLNSGNKIIIVKGNHDLELYWREVRNYLRLILAEEIKKRNSQNDLGNILIDLVLPNITFIDDSVEIDKEFYVEHGHRYDKFCAVLDNPVLKKDSTQLNIPFGSFFNRYLLNRVELFYPFLDNVRPSANVLPVLMRENFPLGLKVLFHHLTALFFLLFKNFRYLWFMLRKVILFILAIALPIFGLYIVNFDSVTKFLKDISEFFDQSGTVGFVINQVKNVIMIFLSYLLTRLAAWFQLAEPSSLNEFAKKRVEGTNYKIMTMGHTHNPGEYLFNKNKRFYNTGTWIPIIENSTADIREDKTYTFLHLKRDKDNKLFPAENNLIQRWNDDAGRGEDLVLVKRK